MIGMTLTLDDVDGVWADLGKLAEDKVIKELASNMIQVAVLPHGMPTGRPSVAFRFDLPDGRTLLVETSARLYCTTANAIMARYPDLFEGD